MFFTARRQGLRLLPNEAPLLAGLKSGPMDGSGHIPRLNAIISAPSPKTENGVKFGSSDRIQRDPFLDSPQHCDRNAVLAIRRAAVSTPFNALGIRVLLIGQPPENFQDPSICCFVQRSILGRDMSNCLRQPRQVADKRLLVSKAILQNVASGRSATTHVSLDSILCNEKACRTWEEGQPLYADRNHLNLSGARVVGKALAERPSLAPLFVRSAAAKVTTEGSRTNPGP